LTITAEVVHQDPTAVINATLFYRNEQQQSQDFIAVPMTHQLHNICIADIPAQDVVGHFVSFYISVTDGSVTKTLPSVDPADQAFDISILPNEPTVITHTPVTSAQEGQDINIEATLTDSTNQVSQVTLYYRKAGQLLYQAISNSFNQTDVQLTASIPGNFVTTTGVQYYLSAQDNFGASATFGTPDAPINVEVNVGSAGAGFTRSSIEVAETAGSVSLTVHRLGGSQGEFTVNYATTDGTATDGSDYVGSSGTLTWADGDSTDKTLTVTISDDTLSEGNESFTVILSDPVSGGNLDSATVSITDNDNGQAGTPQFTFPSVEVAETASTVTLTVRRVGGTNGELTVNYATTDGTATDVVR